MRMIVQGSESISVCDSSGEGSMAVGVGLGEGDMGSRSGRELSMLGGEGGVTVKDSRGGVW